MKFESKIKKLWDYLKVRDDETLVVRRFNSDKGADEFISAVMKDGELTLSVSDEMPPLPMSANIRLVQRRGRMGRHVIPSASMLERDKLIDY